MSKFKVVHSLEEIETNGRTIKLVKVAETDIGNIYYEEDGSQYYYVTDRIVDLLRGEDNDT